MEATPVQFETLVHSQAVTNLAELFKNLLAALEEAGFDAALARSSAAASGGRRAAHQRAEAAPASALGRARLGRRSGPRCSATQPSGARHSDPRSSGTRRSGVLGCAPLGHDLFHRVYSLGVTVVACIL